MGDTMVQVWKTQWQTAIWETQFAWETHALAHNTRVFTLIEGDAVNCANK